MEERFVIVTEKPYRRNEVGFKICESKKDALESLMDLQTVTDVKPVRVFSFNSHGRVTHYNAKLNGLQLSLEPIPQVGERGSYGPVDTRV